MTLVVVVLVAVALPICLSSALPTIAMFSTLLPLPVPVVLVAVGLPAESVATPVIMAAMVTPAIRVLRATQEGHLPPLAKTF
jgi:hypothetical protein